MFVRHDSVTGGIPPPARRPGNALKPQVHGEPDLLVSKNVNSAFFGEPDLHGWLQDRGMTGVAVTGIQTNCCCETTARMAGNLGYDTLFVLDATHTFDLPAHGGGTITADELARVTASNLQDEFADVVMTADLLVVLGVLFFGPAGRGDGFENRRRPGCPSAGRAVRGPAAPPCPGRRCGWQARRAGRVLRRQRSTRGAGR